MRIVVMRKYEILPGLENNRELFIIESNAHGYVVPGWRQVRKWRRGGKKRR